MIRATLEGVTFGIRQALEIIIDPTILKEMTVIGGGSQSRTWVQMIADICGCNLTVPFGGANSPCLGAALVALIGLRVEDSFLSIDKFLKKEQMIHPDVNHQQTYQSLYALYTKLYPTLKPLFAKRKALTRGDK
jgi:xylulokinase